MRPTFRLFRYPGFLSASLALAMLAHVKPLIAQSEDDPSGVYASEPVEEKQSILDLLKPSTDAGRLRCAVGGLIITGCFVASKCRNP